jgi:hypothetical protein
MANTLSSTCSPARGLRVASALAVFATVGAGCGIEGLLVNAGATQYQRPVSYIQGTTPLGAPTFTVQGGDGADIPILRSRLNGPDYELRLASSSYDNLRVHAVQGAARLAAIVPRVEVDGIATDANLDSLSTTLTMLVEARLGVEGKTLQEVPPATTRAVLRELRARTSSATPVQTLRTMVDRLLAKSQEGGAGMVFQQPETSTTGKVTKSAIVGEWLASVSVDYDGDASPDTTTAAFDRAMERALEGFTLSGCVDTERVLLVFAVDFNQGARDGNGDVIQRFRWVTDKPGKKMFFVGGIHKESAIQDPNVDEEMSNIGGGWVPNQVPMFDDGTNGDAKGGDNIWTITFAVPRGARFGYKYTWGLRGDLWTGTEEWPGNQRIIQADDINGDNFIYRLDAFGDEATNKDKVNLFRRGMGSVTWDTDANSDGVPDARERKLDLDGDGTTEWATPKGVAPLTVDCE